MTTNECPHGLTPQTCGYCLGIDRPRFRGPAAEDHVGRVTAEEKARSDEVRPRLLEALGRLAAAGVENPVRFFVDLCVMEALQRGLERWTTTETTRWGPTSTVRGLARGASAKNWSLDVVEVALDDVDELLGEEG